MEKGACTDIFLYDTTLQKKLLFVFAGTVIADFKLILGLRTASGSVANQPV